MIGKIIPLLIFVMYAGCMSAAEVDSLYTRRPLLADAVAVGSSAAINAALTEVFKHTVHSVRPDGSAYDSWPSRHTSYAFAILGSAGYRAARHSGWWLAGAHTAANIVALQRISDNRHYPKDVLGGVATGIVSAAAGEVLSRLIFRGQGQVVYRDDVPERGSADAFTAAVFPIGGMANGYDILTGVKTGIRYSCPIHSIWWLGIEAATTSFQIRKKDAIDPILHTCGMAVGAEARLPVGGCDIEARIMTGAQYNSRAGNVDRWSFTGAATCAAAVNISRTCAVGAEAGYELRTLNSILNSVNISIFSRVRF